MVIQLTPQQQQAVDQQGSELLRLVDPRTNGAYILLPEAEYEEVRELLEEERRQRIFHEFAIRNAANRMDERLAESDCDPI